MKKKQLSVLLVIAIMFSVFSLGGCTVQNNDASNSKGTKADSASAALEKNKIYFDSSTGELGDFETLSFCLYEHKPLGYDNTDIIPWGSKKGKMHDEGNGLWSYDIKANGIVLDSDKLYGCFIYADLNERTSELIIGEPCMGDIVYCTGEMIEYAFDDNQKTYAVQWANADFHSYGIPIQITSLGNVIGNVFWLDESAYTILMDFLTNGLENAAQKNGKTELRTIMDAGEMLGLNKSEIKKAIAEAGLSVSE